MEKLIRASIAFGVVTIAAVLLSASAAVAQTAPPTTVPEPASLALLASGVMGTIYAIRRRRK